MKRISKKDSALVRSRKKALQLTKKLFASKKSMTALDYAEYKRIIKRQEDELEEEMKKG